MQGPQGPPTHLQGPPNQHQQQQSQPNYSNNYSNTVPPMQNQHNSYYGPQGRGLSQRYNNYFKLEHKF